MKINKILKENNLKPYKYTIKGKVYIVDTDKGKYVIKESNNEIYNYLKTRNFDYIPNIVNKDYVLMKYIEDIDYPKEQKINDLIKIVALLHSKTTYYKETNLGEYKEIYETIKNNLNHLESYYNDLVLYINTNVFMSPAEYLLVRNITQIFKSIKFCNNEIDKWYEIIKNTTQKRVAVIHNNLSLNHFLKSDKSYLISWDKSKIDIPIFDLYKLYKRTCLNFDYKEVLKTYEQIYPLKEEERMLFFVLIAMPTKIEFIKDNYLLTKNISKEMDIMFRTSLLISPYYSKQNN